jgi:hypothetical protein
MTLLDRLHEQYESDGDLVLFRCSECGQVDLSLGSLHAHIEGHRGYTRFGVQLPFTKTSTGRFQQLMEYTDVLLVEQTADIDLSEVDAL